MKWIEVNKAKPTFGINYLVSDGEVYTIAQLKQTTKTANGIEYVFDNASALAITHVAKIALPAKEVNNG